MQVASRPAEIGGSVVTSPDESPWYAIRVRSNYERTTSLSLRQKGYTEYTPFYRARRRWSDRTKVVERALFPGYVFCRFDLQKRLPILKTPGVVSIVSFGKRFVPIDEDEIAAIQRSVQSGAGVCPWPHLRAGQRFRIVGGALCGVEGLLLNLKKGRRLVISVMFLQRSVAVEIDREDVEPVF